MGEPKKTRFNGVVTFILLGIVAVSGNAENSIMDIINMEQVEKLLAERRRLNASSEPKQEGRLMMHNSVEGDDIFLQNNNDNDNDDGDEGLLEENTLENVLENEKNRQEMRKFVDLKKNRNWNRFANQLHSTENRIYKIRPNLTGIPDFSSVISNFTGLRLDKMLKSNSNSQVVTRKEYLKKESCKTEPILQKIREDGCLTRTILNRFCYGQCNSFFIPKNLPKRKKNKKKQGQDEGGSEGMAKWEDNFFFKSCGSCRPKKSSWIFVSMRCPSLFPKIKKKKVLRIKQCKCLAENF